MHNSDERLLTINQRRIVGTALGALGLVVITAVFVLIFLLLRAFIQEFGIVIWPLAVAGILAMILQPVVRMMERRLGFSRVWCVLVLYFVSTLVIGLAAWFVLPIVSRQIMDFIQTIPDIIQNILNVIDKKAPTLAQSIRERLSEVKVDDAAEQLRAVAGPAANNFMELMGRVRVWVFEIGARVTAAAIVPVYLFFFLLVKKDPTTDLSRHLDFLKEDWRRDTVFLIRMFILNVEAFFRGQILIALIMGILYAIGFTIVGLKFGIVIGLAMGFLNIVPYLGSMVGLLTALPIAYLQPDGGFHILLWTGVVFTIVQTIEGWILTPRIMGNMTGLHPVVVIIAIFFWGVALGGILGMILAIPLTAFLIVGWRFVFRRYVSHLLMTASENRKEDGIDQ